ncbi:MAG: 50S ribosomal protein L32 [Nitrospinae bacterium]|nr:50S ribosomal protein L32 [Nitrospinota bacterium]
MPVPKKRTSRSRRGMRRSHHALRAPAAAACPECGSPVAPHRVCPACGKYKGKQIIGQEEA